MNKAPAPPLGAGAAFALGGSQGIVFSVALVVALSIETPQVCVRMGALLGGERAWRELRPNKTTANLEPQWRQLLERNWVQMGPLRYCFVVRIRMIFPHIMCLFAMKVKGYDWLLRGGL